MSDLREGCRQKLAATADHHAAMLGRLAPKTRQAVLALVDELTIDEEYVKQYGPFAGCRRYRTVNRRPRDWAFIERLKAAIAEEYGEPL